MRLTVFGDLLDRWLREAPGRPLVTYYDGPTGGRTELSVATYANWVAKAASLLVDELDLGRGDRLLLDLRTHWLGPVLLGAAWRAGLQVVWDGESEAVACGPEAVATWAVHAGERVVLASSLDTLGSRIVDGVPEGVHDLGLEIWAQPDAFVPWDAPTPDDAALPALTQGELWTEACAGSLIGDAGRLLTARNPASPSGWQGFSEAFVRGGSLVLYRPGSSVDRDQIAAAERVTAHWE